MIEREWLHGTEPAALPEFPSASPITEDTHGGTGSYLWHRQSQLSLRCRDGHGVDRESRLDCQEMSSR